MCCLHRRRYSCQHVVCWWSQEHYDNATHIPLRENCPQYVSDEATFPLNCYSCLDLVEQARPGPSRGRKRKKLVDTRRSHSPSKERIQPQQSSPSQAAVEERAQSRGPISRKGKAKESEEPQQIKRRGKEREQPPPQTISRKGKEREVNHSPPIILIEDEEGEERDQPQPIASEKEIDQSQHIDLQEEEEHSQDTAVMQKPTEMPTPEAVAEVLAALKAYRELLLAGRSGSLRR